MTAILTNPPATESAAPKIPPPGGQATTASQSFADAHPSGAGGGSTALDGHPDSDAQASNAVEGSTSEASHTGCDTHSCCAGLGPILADPLLGMCADVVDDLESVRIANENRYRTLTAQDEHGHGLDDAHPDVARLRAIVDALAGAEHQAILNLQRAMRQHPLGAWVKAQPGVGEKQAARLLAVIRDPYWNDLHNRPRTVSELWAYCGFHVLPGRHRNSGAQPERASGSNVHPGNHEGPDAHQPCVAGVAPKRQRGQRSNWNEDARKRAWLIAASCVKQPANTPWRHVYDTTRTKYADATHTTECVRCGPKGKPAQPGTPLSAGHQHARALRAVAKGILKDLWLAAKEIHEQEQPK